MKRAIQMILLLVTTFAAIVFGTGCARPYDRPEIKEISPSQTAFLIPLEGKTSDQGKFMSESFLEKAKVATKRIEIPHRWLKQGRLADDGKWLGTQRLIIVERKPVTREWTENKDSGTSSKNEALGAESKESIAIVARVNCVAQIDEPDAVRYLYRYNEKTLDAVMDSEIRARVETRFVEECAKYFLRDENGGLLVHKRDIMQSVRKDVIPFFKERGITITVLGLKGEFTYDPLVQAAINERFISTQKKAKADNDAYVTQKLGASGIQLQLKLRELDLRKQELDNQGAAIKAWESGKASMPTYVGGSNSIFSIPITTSKR